MIVYLNKSSEDININKQGLSIEFFGLPGSGKSALAEKATLELGKENISFDNILFNFNPKVKIYRILYKMFVFIKQFIFMPRHFLKQIRLIMNTRQKSIKDLTIVVANYFFIEHLLKKSKLHRKNIFLDQGIYQMIWSINLNAKKTLEIEKFLNGIQVPDVIIITDISEELMENRLMLRRKKHSRLEKDISKQNDAINKKAIEVYYDLLDYLKNKNYKILFLDNSTIEQLPYNARLIRNIVFEALCAEGTFWGHDKTS